MRLRAQPNRSRCATTRIKGTVGIEPQIYKAETTGRVQFCGCKKSRKGAICDDTHNRL